MAANLNGLRGRAHVLIADDDLVCRLIAHRSLAGHEVESVDDGSEALSMLLASRPDVAVLDWIMPGLDGIEICRAARLDPALAETILVVMTGAADGDAEQQARQAGADLFLRKPVAPAALANVVERALTERQMHG
jgi:CheY-like chemotaxis protein